MSATRVLFAGVCFLLSTFAAADVDCTTAMDGTLCNVEEGCGCFSGECVKPNDAGDDLVGCEVSLEEETTACDPDMDICGDPHMKGLRGQKIDWFGVDGGWYSFVKDNDADLHINVRLTAPLPEEFPDRQLVTGLSVISGGHSLVLKVKNPYETDVSDNCPDGMPTPCLANGGLNVTVDGEETADDSPLLHPIRGEILPGGGIEVSAANLPVECWEFGGDKIWARHYEDMMAQGRRMTGGESFESWVLGFQHMTAHDWCTKHIAEKGLSDVQSSHAIYQIVTPSVVVRLNVGIGYQTGGELDWDGRVLPDLDAWQMDIGLVGLSLENEGLTGILGETARPVYDKHGHAVMKGNDAFRGTAEDYRLSGELGTDFALLH
ncbi:unnamed protein product [Ectocarpus fasciculatus]